MHTLCIIIIQYVRVAVFLWYFRNLLNRTMLFRCADTIAVAWIHVVAPEKCKHQKHLWLKHHQSRSTAALKTIPTFYVAYWSFCILFFAGITIFFISRSYLFLCLKLIAISPCSTKRWLDSFTSFNFTRLLIILFVIFFYNRK